MLIMDLGLINSNINTQSLEGPEENETAFEPYLIRTYIFKIILQD